jgi:hypothetical protein
MEFTQNKYPFFEANQILTNLHLNQAFNYLDEQERLTRANLIGIGIVCRLEIRFDPAENPVTIHLYKGCGVTSEGHLIVEPEDLALVSYREYNLPGDPEYLPFFKDKSTENKAPYDLWELFPEGEPDTEQLGTPANFLSDKAALLFLELKQEGLRNCSANDCNDRGSQVTVTVRRLLIRRNDLEKLIAETNALAADLTPTDLETALSERLNLPDLRLPRFDAPNTGPATSKDVLAAFHSVFHAEKLALQTGNALSAAYDAFKPLVQSKYPSNPFAEFSADFGFLDNAPATTAQVRFLPYYYDFFADLISAYDAFRWKGMELLCAGCPPEGLFPRHLMLGVVFPASVASPGIYRHHFLASSAIDGCEERIKELAQLFQRLVEMIARFTLTPPMPQPSTASRTDGQIRITPDKSSDAPLSDKAIPYYYLQNGTPPLFQLWDPEKTRRNRANQNLSYRSDEYTPAAPAFITNPLHYDLEPYNFLRIEGHLGKNYQSVMNTLLSLKSRFRLPIEIIALRAGAFDEKIPVDLSRESCRFQDLEMLYDTLKSELSCFLCREVQYFYNLPFEMGSKITAAVKSQLTILTQCAPDFLVRPQTLGRLFEDWLSTQAGKVIPDIDPAIIINFLNTQQAGQSNIIIFYVIIYASKLFDQLSRELVQLDFANFEKRYQDLVRVTEAIEQERELSAGNVEGNASLLNWEELDDRLEDIIFHCRLDAFRALQDEYKRRIREVKQKQFLSFFLRDNPGIQHKAGVPMGGTFIIVYHDAPNPSPDRNLSFVENTREFMVNTTMNRLSTMKFDSSAVLDAFTRIGAKRELAIDPDIRFVLGTFTGAAPDLAIESPPGEKADKIFDATVNELADGTVIADFYLPYLHCSDCPPVQFVLPKTPPGFSVKIGCSNPNNQAEVAITPKGGMAPYSVKVDSQDYQPLIGVLLLGAGSHTLVIQDAEATESARQTITIAQQLVLGSPAFDCIGDNNEYVAVFQINGGSPPYTANRGKVNANTYASDALPGDTEIEIIITDSRQCTASQKFRNSCLPSLAFTTRVGCTTSENMAPVQILPTGGTPPYRVRTGTEGPVSITGPLLLSIGIHNISVLDAADTETASQVVAVSPRLILTESDFTCQGTASYRSFILIQGGSPPYTANSRPVTGNVFTTDPVASGTVVSVTVTDQNNCSATIDVQHACEESCNLPCGGQSRRCAYRLWLQPASGEAKYAMYRPDSIVKFRFNDKDIELPDSNNLLLVTAAQLNADFRNAMGAVIKKLNEVIGHALVTELGDAGANRLVITYDPVETDPFAILLIEYFVCDTFSIEFNYSFANLAPAFSLTMRYTNKPDAGGVPFSGAVSVNRRLNNKETRVPAFDCSERNQCTGSDYKRLCEGPEPKSAISIEPLGNNRFTFAGKVGNMPTNEIAAWVWDAFMAQPTEPFYEGQKVVVQLQKPGGPVRLTAITQKGCFSTVQNNINP